MNEPNRLEKITDFLATPIDYVSPNMKTDNPGLRKGLALVGIPAATLGVIGTGLYLTGNHKKIKKMFRKASNIALKASENMGFGKRKSKKKVKKHRRRSRA